MIGFLLNLPFTMFGFLLALISLPQRAKVYKNPYAVLIHVRSFWWGVLFPWMRGMRAATVGHVILLGDQADGADKEHELIHVRQYQERPLIYPILYYVEFLKKGYRKNKYEIEAYRLSGNRYEKQRLIK